MGFCSGFFGAPFFTGDSGVYLRAALQPWSQFGAHHPSGTSWILWFGRQLGLPPSATLAAVGALEVVLLRQVLSSAFSALASWVIALAFLLYPDFLIMRLSLWSEPGLIAVIAASAVVLRSLRLGAVTRCICLCGLFLAMSEVRHAAIFLLPGLAVATGFSTRFWRDGGKKIFGIVAVMGCLIGAWMILNFARTGQLLAPTTGSFECVHFIAAYHRVPFCSTAPEIPLCQMDSEGVWLRQGLGERPDFISLDRLMFRPESPLNRLVLTGEGSCGLWGMMRKELLANHKVECTKLLISRIAGQFGSWEMSERGGNILHEGVEGAVLSLDRVIALSGVYMWPLWLLWAAALLKGWRAGRLSDPVVVFCLLGGLGHAAGIALNNPFLALRYLAISKYLVSLAAALLLGKSRSTAK